MLNTSVLEKIAAIAQEIGVEPAALAAVVHIESGLRTHVVIDGRVEPLIRFEGHYFDRRLSDEKRRRARAEGLASPLAGAVANPPSQAARWRLLARAAAIDRRAAYESVSWGMGQVMGAHWAWLGYRNVEALVTEARSGIGGQLRLMARYISRAGLVPALRNRDWAAFARGYNGPAFRRNAYDAKLAKAYARYARRMGRTAEEFEPVLRIGTRGTAVRDLQRMLDAFGHRVTADGIFGSATQAAVQAFQSQRGLAADGIVGSATWAALKGSDTVFARLRRWIGSILGWLPRFAV